MSKTLLSESEIKDFMKYANLGKDATNNFIGRLNEHSLAEQEEPAPEEEAPEEEPAGEEDPEAAAPEAEAPEEEGPEGEEAPGAGGEDEAMEAAVEQVVGAIVDALQELPGAPEISMEGGEEEPGMEEPGMEEPGMEEPGMEPEAGAEEEEAPEMAMERLMEAIEEAELYLEDAMGLDEEGWGDEGDMEEGLYEDDELGYEQWAGESEGAPMEEVVNEVTRRVAARILRSRKTGKRR